MKKINLLLIAFLFLAVNMFAATDTGKYWVESVKGANLAFAQKGYIYGQTGISDTLTGTANVLVSYPFGVQQAADIPGQVNPHVRNAFSGTKFLVGINITTAYTNGAASLIIEGSGDGTNWVTIATAISNTAPGTTGVTWALVDLTSTYLPYYRLVFNKAAATVNRVGKLRFLYALPQL